MASFITGYHFKQQLKSKQTITIFCTDEEYYLAYDSEYLYKVKYHQAIVTKKLNIQEITPNYQIISITSSNLLYFILTEDNFIYLLSRDDLDYLKKMTFQTYVKPQIHFIESTSTILVLGQQSQCLIQTTFSQKHSQLQIQVHDVLEFKETIPNMTGYSIKENNLLLWNDRKINVYNIKHFDKDYSQQGEGITAAEITFVYHLLILGLKQGNIKVSLLPSKKGIEDKDPSNMFSIKPHNQPIQHLKIHNDLLHSIAENIGIFDLKSFNRLYTFEYPQNLEYLRFMEYSNMIIGSSKTEIHVAQYFDALSHEFQINQLGRLILNKSFEKQIKYQFLTEQDEKVHLNRKAQNQDQESIYADVQYKQIQNCTFIQLSLHLIDDSAYIFTLYKTGRLVMNKLGIDKKKGLVNIHSSYQRPNKFYFIYDNGCVNMFDKDFKESSFQLEFVKQVGIDTIMTTSLHYKENQLQVQVLNFQTITKKDLLLAIGVSEGQVQVYQLKTQNEQTIKPLCSAQLDVGYAAQLTFVQNKNKIGLIALSNYNRFYLFGIESSQLAKLRLLQVYQLNSQLLMKSESKYLFIALQSPPYTLGVFSFKSASTLILKSVSDYDDHQSAIIALDNDSKRKWILTASKDNTIKIWTYQKFLIANITYHEPINQIWFVNEDFMILSEKGTISLIKYESLQLQMDFKYDVSKECKKENHSYILSINEFFSQQLSEQQEDVYSSIVRQRKMRSPEKVVDISEYRHQYQLRLEKRQKKAKLPISVNGQSRMVDKSSPIKKSSYLVFNN